MDEWNDEKENGKGKEARGIMNGKVLQKQKRKSSSSFFLSLSSLSRRFHGATISSASASPSVGRLRLDDPVRIDALLLHL